MKYRATYEFEAAGPEDAAQRVFLSFYTADIEAEGLKLEQVKDNAEVFSFPMVQSLTRKLQEEHSIRRAATSMAPPAEGDWTLQTGEAGGDL